ncbi:MAG: hypothetical protein Q9191_006616 [Dirinaria sp. TL-2023a]
MVVSIGMDSSCPELISSLSWLRGSATVRHSVVRRNSDVMTESHNYNFPRLRVVCVELQVVTGRARWTVTSNIRRLTLGVDTEKWFELANVNEARAMRIAEVMNDYHMIQRRISQYQVVAPQQDYYEEGYVILRQCAAEAQAVLAAPYDYQLLDIPRGPGENEKRQLQRQVTEIDSTL